MRSQRDEEALDAKRLAVVGVPQKAAEDERWTEQRDER